MKRRLVNFCRVVWGTVILLAIIIQCLTFRQTVGNFFSYFTILGNMWAVAALIINGLEIGKVYVRDMARGSATLYLLLIGLGFKFLLNGQLQDGELLLWVNLVLHYISPILMILDWFVVRAVKIEFVNSTKWLLFLFVYLFYTLIRGSIIGWYPYDFLNPNIVGYVGIGEYTAVLTLVSLLICRILTGLSIRK